MHYLDHAATTPVLEEVREAMMVAYTKEWGNPSSVHASGRAARALVEDARERVAGAIGASPSEIYFTGGGTEADNLAVKGAAAKLQGNGRHIVTTTFEHHGVLEPVEHLGHNGYDSAFVGVGDRGVVDAKHVSAAVTSATSIVSVMAVNNEIGTVQPLGKIVDEVKAVNPNAVVHTDAVQALGNIPVDVGRWGVDLASFSAHKIGGAKGVGCLFVRSGVPVEAVIHGGGHEKGLRSGTLNVAGISGLGVAAEIAAKEVHEKAEKVGAMRDRLLTGIQEIASDAIVNGDLEHRSPNNLNVSIPGCEGETLLLLLDEAGIACSSGSACQSGALDPSHVLLAIGRPREIADGSLRFTFGRSSSEEDVDAVLDVLPDVIAKARS